MDYGLIVDVETTGLNCEEDEIIEVGILEFALEADDEPTVINMYGGLQEPKRPIPREVVDITGIKQEHTLGQNVDWEFVKSFFIRASVVIAHNAEFDCSFLTRVPALQGIESHWACSLNHIDWKSKGCQSRRLNHLAADHGFLNPFAHRALFDCATTFRLVKDHLDELLERSYEKEFLVQAWKAPFDRKELLKGRGYKWAAEERVWYKKIPKKLLELEREFLSQNVYHKQPSHTETLLPSIIERARNLPSQIPGGNGLGV